MIIIARNSRPKPYVKVLLYIYRLPNYVRILQFNDGLSSAPFKIFVDRNVYFSNGRVKPNVLCPLTINNTVISFLNIKKIHILGITDITNTGHSDCTRNDTTPNVLTPLKRVSDSLLLLIQRL